MQRARFVFEDINRLHELILEKLEEKRNQVNTDGAKIASEIIQKLMKWTIKCLIDGDFDFDKIHHD